MCLTFCFSSLDSASTSSKATAERSKSGPGAVRRGELLELLALVKVPSFSAHSLIFLIIHLLDVFTTDLSSFFVSFLFLGDDIFLGRGGFHEHLRGRDAHPSGENVERIVHRHGLLYIPLSPLQSGDHRRRVHVGRWAAGARHAPRAANR